MRSWPWGRSRRPGRWRRRCRCSNPRTRPWWSYRHPLCQEPGIGSVFLGCKTNNTMGGRRSIVCLLTSKHSDSLCWRTPSEVEYKYSNRWKDDNHKTLYDIWYELKTHFVADKLVRLKVGQELVVELLLCRLPVQVFWVILRDHSWDFTFFAVFLHRFMFSSQCVPYLRVYRSTTDISSKNLCCFPPPKVLGQIVWVFLLSQLFPQM